MEFEIAMYGNSGALWGILSMWIDLEDRPNSKEMSEKLTNIIKVNL